LTKGQIARKGKQEQAKQNKKQSKANKQKMQQEAERTMVFISFK
jgi:hypothetical protein